MTRDDGDGSKKQPWRCCFCRSTRKHRCYKCFCGKCPWYKKKVPAVPSMNTSAKKQLVETSEPGGVMTDVAEDGEISPCPSMDKNQRGNDTAENQNDGGFSKPRDGSTTIWDILAEKKTRASENQVGWDSRSVSASSRGTKPWNEPSDNAATPLPSWNTRHDKEPRHYATGSVANWEGNLWNDTKGNDEAEKQKDGGSSKPSDRSTSIWDVLSKKEKRKTNPSENQVGWAPKSGSASSWGTKPWNELRNKAAAPVPSWNTQHDKKPRDTRSASRGNATSSYSRGTWHGNEGRGSGYYSGWDKQPVDKRRHSAHRAEGPRGTRPVNEKRRDPAGSFRNRDVRRVEEPRGNKEAMCSKFRDSSESVACIPHVESGPRWSPHSGKRSRGKWENWTHGTEDLSSTRTKMPRGPQDIVPNTTKDWYSEAVLLKPHVNSGSCQASGSVKEKRGNAEVTSMRSADGSGKALHNHHAQPGSSGDALAVKEQIGNVEVSTERVGTGSEELHNRDIHSDSSLEALKREEPSRNANRNGDIMACTAENRCSVPALRNPNAGFVSTPPSSTAKQTTGCSVSDKETDKDGQHDATIPSSKIEGVVRVDTKFLDPIVASQRNAKPPPVISRESYSTKQKLCSSPQLDQVGPALGIIWKGKFEVPDFPGGKISDLFLAHSAANVSLRAYKFVSQMDDLLFSVHPRLAFWPKIFKSKCPDNRDVALYFYPQRDPRPKKKYATLLKLLEGYDLMLKSIMEGVELLVFSSKLLDSKFQTLEGSLYLWGVFRKSRSEKVASSTDVLPNLPLKSALAMTSSTRIPNSTISPSLKIDIRGV